MICIIIGHDETISDPSNVSESDHIFCWANLCDLLGVDELMIFVIFPVANACLFAGYTKILSSDDDVLDGRGILVLKNWSCILNRNRRLASDDISCGIEPFIIRMILDFKDGWNFHEEFKNIDKSDPNWLVTFMYHFDDSKMALDP